MDVFMESYLHMYVIILGTLFVDIFQYWDYKAPGDWMNDGLEKVSKVVVVA
jgi:hypothetical protein